MIILERNPIQIGGISDDGKAIIFKVDESKYFHRNYHHGQWREGHWVFGGIEQGTCNCFLVVVPDRTEATLRALTEQWILPGSHIVSDGWHAYRNIETWGGGMYTHSTVVHQEHFVDPDDNKVHTQSVENMWMRAKCKIRRQFGTSEALFPSYLHEFIWRQTVINGKYFEQCLNMIHVIYPV